MTIRGLKKSTDRRIDSMRRRMDGRFQAVDRRFDRLERLIRAHAAASRRQFQELRRHIDTLAHRSDAKFKNQMDTLKHHALVLDEHEDRITDIDKRLSA